MREVPCRRLPVGSEPQARTYHARRELQKVMTLLHTPDGLAELEACHERLTWRRRCDSRL